MRWPCLWPLVLLCLSCPVGAVDALPPMQPDGHYSDQDPGARYYPHLPGGRSQLRQAVNAALRKNPRNATALAQRAYLFMEGGDLARARRDFDTALAAAEPGSAQAANVLWSRGWASYDMGDYPATFSDWQSAIALHGGRPFWAAYSLALLYWSAGQPELAIDWYSAAVDADRAWSDEEGMADKTKKWSPSQRERMTALFEAWSATQGG